MGEQGEAQNAAWKIWRIESAEQCIFDARPYRAPKHQAHGGFWPAMGSGEREIL
jgi:hypothetical protein